MRVLVEGVCACGYGYSMHVCLPACVRTWVQANTSAMFLRCMLSYEETIDPRLRVCTCVNTCVNLMYK
jgi:hypothetical protein